jgi:hypothetical protein
MKRALMVVAGTVLWAGGYIGTLLLGSFVFFLLATVLEYLLGGFR